MEALVLCGGQGTRLRSALPDLPKPLAPIGDRPFLQILLEYIQRQGVRRVVLCAGYQADAIEGFCRARRGTASLPLIVSREPRPLGTAGAVKQAAPLLAGSPFVVLNGDSYCPVPLAELARHHDSVAAAVTIAVTPMEDVAEYGLVHLGNRGEIVAFSEKPGDGRLPVQPAAGYVNAGVYVMSRDVLEEIPPGQASSLERDLFPSLIGRGLAGYVVDQPVLDIGTPARLHRAREVLTGAA
jgi:NDP-sugar pyrophosphorylase family protein